MSAFRGLPAVVSLVVRAALAALFVLAAGSRAFATDYVVTKTADSADGFCDADCA